MFFDEKPLRPKIPKLHETKWPWPNPDLRAKIAAADRLAASVRRVKAHMIEQGIGPDNVEREMFELEADYTKMKGGE